MSRGGDATQWTAEQTLSYINGLLAAEDQNNEESYNSTLYTALSISYEYLTNATKRKITWSLSLQKLAYEFINLAFETNMHSAIKDIFKSYRAITQGQYSQSLKDVLEHYRDRKLETILEDEEISTAELPMIRALPNIQIDDPSAELILDSLHPEVKQRQIQIRNKLKLVWEGYKSIVETVRVNQKLQNVYMATLSKIFDFVDRYNRVQEFKSFCKSLRTGLQTAFSKRDKYEQQKSIYIDIEKTDVNTRNIEIRMEQFRVATKLGLWAESFQILEDVNNIIKVRKAPLKNSLKCQYFESLALLFSKNNFWHYHAFAYLNYYNAYMTKPKITPEEKARLSDRLLLSILAIPQVNIEKSQPKEIKEKVCSMIIPSGKIPDKSQLVETMVSRGVLENASQNVKELWSFMFLEFGVSSLQRGLELVGNLGENYSKFHSLIEATLINRQLLSLAEVYHRIRISSLERLIPLPLEKIKKILIEAHHEKTLDFTFDQNQGILVFEEDCQQINPSEEFHEIFMQVSLLVEEQRKPDETHIRRKAEDYLANAEQNIWSIRQYKIDEFKKKLKKPLMELRKANLRKEKDDKERREKEEIERKIKEAEAIKKGEEMQKLLAMKRIIINDIISIKETRVIRIMDKKIQNLTDQQVDNLSLQVLQEHLEATKKKITNNKQARLRKVFTQVDFLQRERRDRITPKIQNCILEEEKEKAREAQLIELAKKDYDDHHSNLAKVQKVAKFYKSKIEKEVILLNKQYDSDLEEFKKILKDNFKNKVLTRAKALFEENLKKREQQLKQAEEQQKAIEAEQSKNGNWSFRKSNAPTIPKAEPEKPHVSQPTIQKSSNVFDRLEGVKEQRQERVERKVDTGQKWSIGSKKNAQEKKEVTEPAKVEHKLVVPPPVVEVKIQEKKSVFQPPPPTNPAPEKKGKWADTQVSKQPEKKVEEKKPEPVASEKKKGKWA